MQGYGYRVIVGFFCVITITNIAFVFFQPPKQIQSNTSDHQIEPDKIYAQKDITCNDSDTIRNNPRIQPKDIIRTLYVIKSDSEPPFYLYNDKKVFPRVDGDEAQQYIVENLKLKELCQENPNTIVVDIGAFLGDFGLKAASYGCKVYMFEPTPIRYHMIRASIELNGFLDKVKLYNYAVSDKRTTVVFEDKGGSTNQIPTVDPVAFRQKQNLFTIDTITLDEVIPFEDIYLMKVDVEGFEPTVLFGGSKGILGSRRVRHIISEYTPWWETNGKGPWYDFLDTMYFEYGTNSTQVYGLHRERESIHGPLHPSDFKRFYNHHKQTTSQTDVYFDIFGEKQVPVVGEWSEMVYA